MATRASRGGARLRRSRTARIGFGIVVVLLLFATLGPLLSAHDPFTSHFDNGIGPGGGPVGPGSTYLLGVDRVYRDVFARLAYGARISLSIGLAATLIASVIGLVTGVISGWYEGSRGVVVPWASLLGLALAAFFAFRGHSRAGTLLMLLAVLLVLVELAGRWPGALRHLGGGPRLNVDVALMRFVDVGLSFPFLLLVMAVGAALERTTAGSILMVLGFTGWLGIARVIRAKTMQVRSFEFVVASQALGEQTVWILMRHVVPNVLGPLLVLSTASVAQMIVAESVLGYLGVGIAPPTPSWGHMLFEGQDYYLAAPWMVLAPGVAILLSVLGFNLLGEGLRDAFDPHDA